MVSLRLTVGRKDDSLSVSFAERLIELHAHPGTTFADRRLTNKAYSASSFQPSFTRHLTSGSGCDT
jgi:hypothetical protein